MMSTANRADRSPLEVVNRFNDAWNRANLDDLLALISENCVFENTSPSPDGERFTGKVAVGRAWAPVLETAGMRFEAEELFEAGDRVVVRWVYHWTDGEGSPGHVRGVDLIRVRDGLVSEKLSYVKG